MSGAESLPADAMRLNAICPYFTMFPLEFPLSALKAHARPEARVLDPFCGRGTTNFAARLLGLKTVGIDASRVAVAATKAKLADPSPREIVDLAKRILNEPRQVEVPAGEFWRLAYHPDVLRDVCRIRDSLIEETGGHASTALRGIMLGALHGPVGRTRRSYFSNQCPRTYGPKPAYAVKFWKNKGLAPPNVDVLGVVADRAQRYYGSAPRKVDGAALDGDSRDRSTMAHARQLVGEFDFVVTSPPYYGLRTYLPDQWIRNWFLGGPPIVDYSSQGQVSHNGRERFVADLREVWRNVGAHCRPGAKMVVRFGSIGDRVVDDPARLLTGSLEATGWAVTGIEHAANAASGKRQADSFRKSRASPFDEVDVIARWSP